MKKNNPATEIGLADQLLAVLKTHTQTGAFFLLALSGGVDSIVLLHVLTSLKEKFPFKLHAMHINHGLSAFADDWANHCQQVCHVLEVPLKVVNVQVNKSKVGVEAAARAARYEALFAYRDENNVQPDFIVTAHHEQDQAETLLLQLSRGAGVKGLAGMALLDEKKRLLRPMLAISKEKILNYAEAFNLRWCDDESNQNTLFERNFLRHEIMPVWSTRHPALHQNIVRSATHLAEARHLLEALAEIDAEPLVKNNSLCLVGLKKLALARAKNVLRWWLACFAIQMPNTEYLNEILAQLFSAGQDADVDLKLQGYALKCFQHRAYLVKKITSQAFDIIWRGEEYIQLPSGVLEIRVNINNDGFFSLEKNQVNIRSRQTGEQLKIAKNRPARRLKYLMQEAGIPPWQRASWPLVYLNQALVCIPNVGVADHLQEKFQQAGLQLAYSPY